jgi:hypothetical protein
VANGKSHKKIKKKLICFGAKERNLDFYLTMEAAF